MRLNIRHNTQYSYSETVFLEPHYLLMEPLQRSYISLESITFDISPQPSGQADILDAFNNPMLQLWFNEMQNMLHIETEIVVELTPYDPFAFLPDLSAGMSHGEIYSASLTKTLSPFLHFSQEVITPEMQKLLEGMKTDVRNNAVATVTDLLEHIHQNWDHHIRLRPDVLSPDKCFDKKKGSCRDLAWMMMNMLRYLGLATRFVSGYAYDPQLGDGHELHAWLEVSIPGGGWVGIDPSLGLFAADHFVPVAVSDEPQHAMPVRGTYRGSATSSLDSMVTIKRLGQ